MTTSETSTQRYNILWIGVDQMRADTPGFAGNPVCQTPHLDALAAESVVFRRAYTPASLCSPARASMYTGLFAFKHGMLTNCDMYHSVARELPHPEQLLHYRLQSLGYRTGITGKWHVGTYYGPSRYGFESIASPPGYGDLRDDPGFQRYLAEKNLRYGPIRNPIFGNTHNRTLLAGEWNGPLESTPTVYLANTAIDMLNDYGNAFQRNGTPFFLTCQFWAPHGPYLPSPEYVGRHDRALLREWANFHDDHADKPTALRRFRRDFYQALPTDWNGWREIVGLAYDYTTLVDEQIGRLLAQVKARGLLESTIIVFTSDHGDMLGSHGGLFDKGFIYEEAHRVPLMIRLPDGSGAGMQRDDLVYNMDILPTFFDLIGHNIDREVDGRSLKPLLNHNADSSQIRATLYLEFHGIRSLQTQRALVTSEGEKYVFNPTDEDEYYDLTRDPAELHNLLRDPQYVTRIAVIRKKLVESAAQTGDPVQNYMAKLFGDYETLSDQPDVSAAYTVQK
jgi:arylsulfatase A-like enzyme